MERKQKFSLEQKLNILDLVLKKNYLQTEVCKKFKVSESELNHWIDRYRTHGKPGLVLKSINNNYSPELKLKVITEYKNGLVSLNQLAKKYNISRGSLIYQWIVRLDKEGSQSLLKDNRGKKSTMKRKKVSPKDYHKLSKEEMLRELQYLNTENAYLKKLDALIQEEQARENLKKR